MKIPLINQKAKGSPEKELSSLEIIQRKLEQNSLTEFRVGFESNEFRSKRDVQSLISTIEGAYMHTLSIDRYSNLVSIRIGWRLPSFALGPILERVLPLLLKKPGRVQNLEIALNARVPLPVMTDLVACRTLRTLDLRAICIQTKILSEPRFAVDRGSGGMFERTVVRHSSTGSIAGKRAHSIDESSYISSETNILAVVPYLSPSIRALKLVDCGLRASDMPTLIQFLRPKRQIRFLSLRHNRDMKVNGWEKQFIQQLPFIRALDLSICDLNEIDGLALSRLLEFSGKSSLQSLSIEGNYQMKAAVPDILKAGARGGLLELDCSFCDVQNKTQAEIFETLATAKPCTLRSLKMQAVNVQDANMLIKCIKNNTSLERLILNRPREPLQIPSKVIDEVSEAVKVNYYLQVLRFDTQWNQDPRVLDDIQHWLTLNRCGRSALVNDRSQWWPRVLSKVGALNDIDALHWMVRNGAAQFG